jgi:replication-associated recombination protein RarA
MVLLYGAPGIGKTELAKGISVTAQRDLGMCRYAHECDVHRTHICSRM